MPVQLYSMKDCHFCRKAKDKLDMLGIPYEVVDIEEQMRYRPGWRDDGSVELLATLAMADGRAPVLGVGGEYHAGYSKAMSAVKRLKGAVPDAMSSAMSSAKGSGPEKADRARTVRAVRDEVRPPPPGERPH